METELALLRERLNTLETRSRRLRAGMLLTLLAVAGWWVIPRSYAQQPDVVRARGVIIEDANGRARVILGPLDPPPSTRGLGLRINDPGGAERLALYLTDSGRAGIGLDAPPGKGDDRNRERINLTADENGSAQIRFLDRRTLIAARTYLDEENRVWMQFSDFAQKPPVIRRYGLTGEEVVRAPQ